MTYNFICPTCKGEGAFTARTMDDTIARSGCVNGHTFMRSDALPRPVVAATKSEIKKFYVDLNADLEKGRKLKIEAAQRLLASQELRLMAKATPVTKVAEIGIREIGRQMALRGYIANTEITRAFYTTIFEKQEKDSDPCVFQLVGWHGNGHYGNEKTILEFYDDAHGRKPVITIGQINEDNLTEGNQQKVIDLILDYIRKHC